uniref:Uncharacterized protein LOC105635028 isoform X1 n=1 Tax=Rhizophora mucronata TaxID=61149 RepID=A0A2P2L8T7_RHIMU
MLVSGSKALFRVDRALKLVNLIVNSELVNYFQGDCSHRRLSFSKKLVGGKVNLGSMDLSKKQRPVEQIRRQISSQASSMEEDIIKDVIIESERGYQDQEVLSISSSILNHEQVTQVAESVTINSTTLEEKVEDGSLEGESAFPAEKHILSVEVAASLVRFIVGKGGCMKKKIEEELGVKITIPSPRKEEPVVIEGFSLHSVTEASQKIQAIIDEAVKSPSVDYSHFISLPLAIHPELVGKLVNFQNTILGNNNASVDEKGDPVEVGVKVEDERHANVDSAHIPVVSYAPKASKTASLSDLGIDKSIFIKPKTFHLTVLMLKLWNKERVNAASEVLESISSKVMDALDNRPIAIRLKGLDCMKGSLAKARVLYATVEEASNDGRLMRACQVIIDEFVKAGLVLERDAKHTLKVKWATFELPVSI